MKKFDNIFDQVVSLENLFASWDEFKCGKNSREDVQGFEFFLEQNIFELHSDLTNRRYKHGPYHSFYVCDPKVRHIHKATVRDRIVHHAVFRILNPIFEPMFIPTSFSCRLGKGTHKGVKTLAGMLRKESRNYSRNCWALKCDVKKFFDSLNHDILYNVIAKRIKDADALWLIREIIGSYSNSNISGGGRVKGCSYWQSHVATVCKYLYE